MPDTSKVDWTGDEQIAMLIYPGLTVMDLIGPHCMFGALMGAKIFLVAKSLDPVISDAGITITPTATFKACPRGLTVLFTPGGTDDTLATAVDPETRAFMADREARANRITGAGVTAGLDLGLTMVAELRDRIYAECCQWRSVEGRV